MDFETRLGFVKTLVENYIRFRLNDSPDWEDVAQEVFTLAYLKYGQLRDQGAFKSWILAIARNRCTEYYRTRSIRQEVPLEELPEAAAEQNRFGLQAPSAVEDTLEKLKPEERRLLEMTYWEEMSQRSIADALGIPVGTVKSRLYKAKQHFREVYPCHQKTKGAYCVKIPKKMPEYTIEKIDAEPFRCRWEELMGWFIVPRVGEKLSWGIYDTPEGRCSHVYEMEVAGKAKVHGVDGVEIVARERGISPGRDPIRRIFIAQLTESRCRYLAALRTEGDVRNYITFLDEDVFMPTWGYGENNCGHPVDLTPVGDITRIGDLVATGDNQFLLDVVGRYRVRINGKDYDTICLMDMEGRDCNVFSEQYIDKNGRTILWRRFNRDDWQLEQYGGMRWSQRLPANDRLTVNGNVYVHWYDCISSYIC